MATISAGEAISAGEGSRPTARLPGRQLAIMSVYWFGISAIWGGYETFGQRQVELIVGRTPSGLVTGFMELLGGLMAIAVVPTMGTISDYTVSRWGRRKGYIISGAILDFVFLGGLALLSQPTPEDWDGQAIGSIPIMALYIVFFLGLQFSSNFAQGPYQGYVPDLVPEPQVGIASGAMGVMKMTGLVGGLLIMTTVGIQRELWGLAIMLLAVIELTLAILTFLFVQEGPAATPRGGRRWRDIAREAWGTDVLRERSFLRMTGVRFLFLMGTGIFVNVSLWYVDRSLGIHESGEQGFWVLASGGVFVLATVCSALPAAQISNRTGRKPVIWAAAAISLVGVVWLALAPTPPIALIGAAMFGVGSGAYISVDWALMTEVIPLAASGRYMGLANIANSISGPIGLVVGGVIMYLLGLMGRDDLGPRAAILVVGTVALVGAAWLLRGVQPKRDPRSVAGSPAAA
jgi:MFS family permease